MFDKEAAFKKLEEDLTKENLNPEVLITILKEFERLSKASTHRQLHVLLDFVGAIHAGLSLTHMQVALTEGEIDDEQQPQ